MRKISFIAIVGLVTAIMLSSCTQQSTNTTPAVGTIVRDTLLGVPCCVYLPSNYAERVQKAQEIFPVLYLQHGMYGSEDDWTVQGNLLYWMDSLLQCGAVKEMVVVMPDNFLGSMPPAERQALIDAPNITPQGEPFDTEKGAAHWRKFTREQERGYEMSGYWEKNFPLFMEAVEQRYSVSNLPAQRAIAGLSMGGFHTMHVSHYLHGQFGYIGLFSALVVSPNHSEVYDNWQEEVRLMMDSHPLYWIGMGKEDFLYDQLQDYRKWLEQNNIEYTYYESQGGHTWPNWQDYICRFMQKLF
jgi:enterochelin esterase family protein